jgi:hypothetical protein
VPRRDPELVKERIVADDPGKDTGVGDQRPVNPGVRPWIGRGRDGFGREQTDKDKDKQSADHVHSLRAGWLSLP